MKRISWQWGRAGRSLAAADNFWPYSSSSFPEPQALRVFSIVLLNNVGDLVVIRSSESLGFGVV